MHHFKSREDLKGSLNSIPSPSPSVKIQIKGGKVCLMRKGKTLLGVVNKLFVFNSLLTTPSNVLPLHLKQTFPPLIWIFTEGEGDGIKFMLPSKIFSPLQNFLMSKFTIDFVYTGKKLLVLKLNWEQFSSCLSKAVEYLVCYFWSLKVT